VTSPLVSPRRALRALRDQIGSVRGVYLAGNAIARKDDFGARPELVLLLHGFFQTRNIFEVMEDRLRYDGYSVASFNLGGLLHRFNTHPVDRLAELIAAKIEGLAERHGFERLHIVGHSKGGILARRYVQHFGGDRRAKSVTTLGTPHHGTPTALAAVALSTALWRTTSARDLLPRSKMIARLAEDPFPAHIPLTSIYSKADLVCPHWCSVLRPAPGEDHVRNVEIPDVGHSALTWDPRVYKAVRGAVESASGGRARDERRTAMGGR